MKVLMLSKAPILGAYQKKLEELAKFPDVELTVIVPPFWRETRVGVIPLEREYLKGYRLIVEKMALNGRYHIHFYPNLSSHVWRIKPDIFHIDEEAYNVATAQAMFLGRLSGARCLFYTWANINRRFPFPFNMIERYNFASARHAVAGNRAAADILREKGFSKPISVIPQFGVDPDLYRPKGDPSNGSRDSFVIGYVGRIVEQKGVSLLVRAAAGLEGAFRLVLVGSGEQHSELKVLAKELGIEDRVEFKSSVPSCEVPQFLSSMNVLVLPSLTRPNWKEQFGRVLIEAMACGVPVVGSDSGEIPNVIGGDGLVFPEGNVDVLRTHLQRLMSDAQLRRELSAKGRDRVLARYTQAKVAQEYYSVYRKMLGQSKT
ncbi:MAG: glycosyltransferase family 4 protein [Chloroflexi bacterium]|nr:glycosyltransferase family 4 protein [Chloroflexota bacterium]